VGGEDDGHAGVQFGREFLQRGSNPIRQRVEVAGEQRPSFDARDLYGRLCLFHFLEIRADAHARVMRGHH
jgi:hypothetical protein